jgi:hypothetical protein
MQYVGGRGEVYKRFGGGCCENGDEPSISIKCGKFHDQMRKYQLLKKDSASWSLLISCAVPLLR